MDSSFSAGRGMLKWPFSYKGTSSGQKTCSGPLPGPGPILQPSSYSQTSATSALGQHEETIPGSAGSCLGKGRGVLLPWPCWQLGVCAGCPPAGQACSLEHSQSHCPAPLCASPTRLAAAFLCWYCHQFCREQEQSTVLALKNTAYK